MMRLAYFVNNPQFFLSHWESLALAARKAGYDVHVICPDGDAVGTIRSREWPVHVVSLDRTFGAPLKEVRSIGQVSRLYGGLKPDVVHHLSLKPITYGGIAARIARVPAVAATVTGLGYAFSHSGARARFARSAVITLSHVALRHPNQLVFFENEDDQSLFDKLAILRTGESTLR